MPKQVQHDFDPFETASFIFTSASTVFKSGFISIIGKPNAGKSSLMNALLGEKLSIITPKAQTTRHRIRGIITTKKYQVVFSDTPGIIETKYQLHQSMMNTVNEALEDADVLLLLSDLSKPFKEFEEVLNKTSTLKVPRIAVLNKIDLVNEKQLKSFQTETEKHQPLKSIIAISAVEQFHLDLLLKQIVDLIPQQPAFFPEDTLTDRSERFFITEMIREKIFLQYQKEVPYSAEVAIVEWDDQKELTKLRVEIAVERESQKGILLGSKGSAIKQMGIAARADIERFLERKIYLELTVKVKPGWRNDERMLKYYGYDKKKN